MATRVMGRPVAPNRRVASSRTMRQILVISSHVAYGTIGLAADGRAAAAGGHRGRNAADDRAVEPSGAQRFAGKVLEPTLLEDMTAALDANGWLGSFDAVLSGYLPSAGHVAWVRSRCRADARTQSELSSTSAIRSSAMIRMASISTPRRRSPCATMLLPVADVLTPNRFELAWLSGVDVQSVQDAVSAARILARPKLAATSFHRGRPNWPTCSSPEGRACRQGREAGPSAARHRRSLRRSLDRRTCCKARLMQPLSVALPVASSMPSTSVAAATVYCCR